jgi:hypothetical protein
MKNILTIAATGVICVLAGATQTLAQLEAEASSKGTATLPCKIQSTTEGTLGLTDTSDLSTKAGTKAQVLVICGTNAKLQLLAPTVVGPKDAKFTTESAFAGGDKTYIGATGTEIKPAKTSKTGSTAFINHSVSGKDGEFLPEGDYVVTTKLKLVP